MVPLSLFIAGRTALSSQTADGRRASRSPAVGVAVTAVALCVTIMLCALAIVAGFREQIIGKIRGFNADMQIYRVTDYSAPEPDNLIEMTPRLREILASQEYIKDYESELTVPALLKTKTDFKGIYIKGTDGKYLASFLADNIVRGEMPDFSLPQTKEDIAISQKMASELGLDVGDSIPTFYLGEEIMARRYRIAAIYATHFEQFDDLMALGNLSDLRDVAGVKGERSVSIRVISADPAQVDNQTSQLQQTLNQALQGNEIHIPLQVQPITLTSAAYFSWLSLLDTNVAVILALMTVVACITLIAAMLILILDKVRMIGILRALGATRSRIRGIFIWLALRIAFYGLLIGNIIGIGLLYIQQHWHFATLDAEAYYIDFVPVRLEPLTLILLNVAVAIVVVASLLLPSIMAGRIRPSESMRYND